MKFWVRLVVSRHHLAYYCGEIRLLLALVGFKALLFRFGIAKIRQILSNLREVLFARLALAAP